MPAAIRTPPRTSPTIAQPGRLLDPAPAAAIVVPRRDGRAVVRAPWVVAGGLAVVAAVEVDVEVVRFRPCFGGGGLGLTAPVAVSTVGGKIGVKFVVKFVVTSVVTLVMSVSVLSVPVRSPGAAAVSPASAKPAAQRTTAAPAPRKRLSAAL